MSATEQQTSIINSNFTIPAGKGVLQVAIKGLRASISIELPEKNMIKQLAVEDSANFLLRLFGPAAQMVSSSLRRNEASAAELRERRDNANRLVECIADVEALDRFAQVITRDFEHYGMQQILDVAFQESDIKPVHQEKENTISCTIC